MSDIEGKGAWEAANECGQRVSFNETGFCGRHGRRYREPVEQKVTKAAKFLLPELSLRFLRFLL